MTYPEGSYVIYGVVGVCKVESIGPLNFSKEERDRLYYTLCPVYSDGNIYVPLDTQKYMRPVLTAHQAQTLIQLIPEIKEEAIDNSNIANMAQHYMENIKSNDCEALIGLIKAFYSKKQNLPDNKKLGQIDERYMKQAEELLHGEMAVALDIPLDQAAAYIGEQLKATKAETVK